MKIDMYNGKPEKNIVTHTGHISLLYDYHIVYRYLKCILNVTITPNNIEYAFESSIWCAYKLQ